MEIQAISQLEPWAISAKKHTDEHLSCYYLLYKYKQQIKEIRKEVLKSIWRGGLQ